MGKQSRVKLIILCVLITISCSCKIVPSYRKTRGISHLESDEAKKLYHSNDLSSDNVTRHNQTKNYQVKLSKAATQSIGQKKISVGSNNFRGDCSGTVRGIYHKAGVPIPTIKSLRSGENDVSIIYRAVKKHGSLHKTKPQVGDFVFFDNSYDRNRDGRLNDRLTHIGVIEKIDQDQTIWVIHHASGRILRFAMHLEFPTIRKNKNGKRYNHYLRRQSKFKAATTGELFVAFGTLNMPE